MEGRNGKWYPEWLLMVYRLARKCHSHRVTGCEPKSRGATDLGMESVRKNSRGCM